MEKNDSLKILAVLKAAYPFFYKNANKEEIESVVNLWSSIFKDEPYKMVSMAIGHFIKNDTTGYPPTPGKINGTIKRMHPEAKELTEGEAWELVYKAIKNSAWGAEEEFLKLPEVIKDSVGSPSMLRSWGATEIETVQSVIQSNFMRTYREKSKEESEIKSFPKEIRNLLKGVSDTRSLKKLIEEGEEQHDKDNPQRGVL